MSYFSGAEFQGNLIYAFDLLGTVIFAITGAVRGVRSKLDLLGVIVFACTVGVGGGMLRDVLIGATPVAAICNETYLILCIVTGMAVFFTAPLFGRTRHIITICDAFGLGVFTAIGAAKGVTADLHVIGIVLSGVVTAVGGGVIRDIMAMKIPVVFTSDFYATASLLGGLLYCAAGTFLHVPFFEKFMIVMVFVTGIRLLAIRYKLSLPVSGSSTANILLRRGARRKLDIKPVGRGD